MSALSRSIFEKTISCRLKGEGKEKEKQTTSQEVGLLLD